MRAIRWAFLSLVAVATVAIAAQWLLPRRHQLRERLTGVVAFWHDDEAFVFVERSALARGTNALVDRLPRTGAWVAVSPMLSGWRGLVPQTTAFRVADGRVERYELTESVIAPAWDLEDGRLVARSRFAAEHGRGFRWTGAGFARLGKGDVAAPDHGPRTLVPDDAAADEQQMEQVVAAGLMSRDARDRLVGAGWHFKRLNGYEGLRGAATLPMRLASGAYALTLHARKVEDALTGFATTVELRGERLGAAPQVLFADAGWREAGKAEIDARTPPSGGSGLSTTLLLLLFVSIALVLLKAGGVLALFAPFVGLRKRLLAGAGTTMSFPPALPEQFPALDRERLLAWTHDLERLGFEKLVDTAPVSDSPHAAPSFCRIHAHRRHACYAVIMQSFPPRGEAVDLRCMLNAPLSDGWLVGASNGRPLATGHFARRPRALGVSFPGATLDELLARFLRLREQVCGDLGVRPVPDTSLESYIRLTIASLGEIRAEMTKRSLLPDLLRYYGRRLGIGEASARVWLGDYPRVAAQRRGAGLGPGFSGTGFLA